MIGVLPLFFSHTVSAHPFESGLYGHRLEVTVTADRAVFSYAADIPTRRVSADLRAWERQERLAGRDPDPARFLARLDSELRGGISVTDGGEGVAGASIAVPSPLADASGVTRLVSWEVPLAPDRPHRLRVSNGNNPEERAVFFLDDRVDPAWVVEATDLAGREGRWSQDEKDRVFSLDLAPRAGLRRLALLRPFRADPIQAGKFPSLQRELIYSLGPWLSAAFLLLLGLGLVRRRRVRGTHTPGPSAP